MSNAEALAKTRYAEDGYDSFNAIHGKFFRETAFAVVKCKGIITIYKPKEEKKWTL